MKKTRTFYPAHPIQEVIFSLQFGEIIDETTISKLALLKEAFKHNLPKIDDIKSFSFELQSDGTIPIPKSALVGISFQHLRENGIADWIVRVQGNTISINCSDDYTGWDEIWPKTRNYLETLSDVVNEKNQNQIKTIKLQYINRFICSEIETYSWKEIFKETSPYLTEKVKTAGPSWHLFQGWLEKDAIINCECLSNLNLGASIENNEHLTSIALFRQAKVDIQVSQIDSIMNQLHANIKKILSDVIAAEWVEKIGLNK